MHQKSHGTAEVSEGLLLGFLHEIHLLQVVGNEELQGHLDVGDPDAEKLDCFFAFLQEKLKWTC